MNRPKMIEKILSMNDTGETGGHQAGILVPKNNDILTFFPDLGCNEKNPRVVLLFKDEFAQTWKFNFIYYNNKFFDSHGTRNEYRLTGMTAYFRENELTAGDSIFLSRDNNDLYSIRYIKVKKANVRQITSTDGKAANRLVLGSGWKVINY